jgi:hypothetical protein
MSGALQPLYVDLKTRLVEARACACEEDGWQKQSVYNGGCRDTAEGHGTDSRLRSRWVPVSQFGATLIYRQGPDPSYVILIRRENHRNGNPTPSHDSYPRPETNIRQLYLMLVY